MCSRSYNEDDELDLFLLLLLSPCPPGLSEEDCAAFHLKEYKKKSNSCKLSLIWYKHAVDVVHRTKVRKWEAVHVQQEVGQPNLKHLGIRQIMVVQLKINSNVAYCSVICYGA